MTNSIDVNLELKESPDVAATQMASFAAQDQSNAASRLGVVIGGQKVLLQLSDVIEVLPVPHLQSVPLTKAWYLGVANVRGNLYSVTDLAQFLNWPVLKKSMSNRIVLLNSVKTTQSAIVIDSVIGLRNIEDMQVVSDELSAIDGLLQENETNCFSSISYSDNEQNIWLALDVDHLVQNPQFIQPGIG